MDVVAAPRPARSRLTDRQRRDRAMSESELLTMVVSIAELYGWSWVHFRPAQTAKGWRTPVQGPLGKGWPDLVLVRARDQRLLFVELKAEQGAVSVDQSFVLEQMRWLALDPSSLIEVHVWRPSDLGDTIETGRVLEVLGRPTAPERSPA